MRSRSSAAGDACGSQRTGGLSPDFGDSRPRSLTRICVRINCARDVVGPAGRPAERSGCALGDRGRPRAAGPADRRPGLQQRLRELGARLRPSTGPVAGAGDDAGRRRRQGPGPAGLRCRLGLGLARHDHQHRPRGVLTPDQARQGPVPADAGRHPGLADQGRAVHRPRPGDRRGTEEAARRTSPQTRSLRSRPSWSPKPSGWTPSSCTPPAAEPWRSSSATGARSTPPKTNSYATRKKQPGPRPGAPCTTTVTAPCGSPPPSRSWPERS